MKIVCDACQAKYSIADDKIQGRAFKIRCKKCNHIIVVKLGETGAAGTSGASAADKPRTTGSRQAAHSPVPATRPVAQAPAEQAVWHVVVDGEQVGPVTESEIKDHLRAGSVNSDTLVWKEGFGDWTQFSAVPELTPLLAKITRHPVAAAKPARTSGSRAAVAAAAAAPASDGASATDDPFAAPTVVSPAGTADLFASAMAAPAPAPAAPAAPVVAPAPAAATPFLFGGAPAQPEPVVARPSGGNGAGTTHLTGQRNENSVLFSLSNLEALAVPAHSPGIRAPSSSGNTEGSGLIDIRSMAAMTLGDGPGESHRSAEALPTFSTPQFSPVAPVLLPMSMSGPPKWVYPVLALLGIAITAVGISIYMVASKPPPGLPPPPPPPAPVAAPAPAAAPAAAPTAEPAAAAAEPAEEEPAAGDKAAAKPRTASSRGDRGRRRGGDTGGSSKGSDSKKGSDSSASASSGRSDTGKGSSSGRKGGRSLDDLLGEVGTKKGGGSGGGEPAKPAVNLITLTQSDIVNAMRGVQPKVQACANQYKAPGTAMATISVANGGRVSSVKVTGKFAGTPSGSCVEAAAKSAKFPPCKGMTFPWPFTLSPR
jgi:predicted Zn finger-like uncharacterized protein